MITASTLNFLKALKKNNNKEWFEANRNKYNAVKENFESFITALLQVMAKSDSDLKELSSKDCIFRINRDLRFSKNKTPYKISRSASLNRGGKKSIYAGYYIQIQPDGNSFAGGGIWMPEPVQLRQIRQEIDYCFPEFKKIIAASSFKKHYGDLEKDDDRMLVNVPKGYEKDNPASVYLRMKSFIATEVYSDKEVLDPKFDTKVVQSFKALTPLIQFINRSFD